MKIANYLKLYVLLLVFVLVACTSDNTHKQNSDTVLVPVNLTSPQKEFPLSSFIDSVTTFRLTLPDSLFFGTISRIFFDSDNIYAADFKQHIVFRFNRSGCFLNTIGQKGSGPGEYTEMSSCFLGKDCLFVDDLITRRIFCYKPDGTFMRSISFPFNVIYDDIVALSDSNFLCYELFCSPENHERGLWIMNGKGEKTEFVLKETEVYPYSSSMFTRLATDSEGVIHAFNPSSGDFYTYNPLQKELKNTFRLKPDVKLKSKFKGYRTTLDIKEEMAGCDMVIESDHYIYTLWTIFSNNPNGRVAYGLYHKQTGEMRTFTRPVIDLPDMFAIGRYVSSNYLHALVLQYPDEYLAEYYPEEYKKLGMKENMLLVKVLHFK